jgi:hypothetical protein
MSSNTQILRDRNGYCIGEIRTDYDGVLILRDRNGRRLGEYDPRLNVTRDRDGYRVGEGNLLVALIRL